MKFEELLAELGDGDVLRAIETQLLEVVDGVVANTAPGELTLKLKIKPDGQRVDITANVSGKTPQPNFGQTKFFVGNDGDLSRKNPRQRKLDFRANDVHVEDDGVGLGDGGGDDE